MRSLYPVKKQRASTAVHLGLRSHGLLPIVLPELASAGTYAPIIDKSKRQWSHKATVLSPPQVLPSLSTLPSLPLPYHGPPATLRVSVCECRSLFGRNLTRKICGRYPVSCQQMSPVVIINIKLCLAPFFVTKTTINRTASLSVAVWGSEPRFKVQNQNDVVKKIQQLTAFSTQILTALLISLTGTINH